MSVGAITIDGTRINANASMDQNRSHSALVKDILREADETDRQENEVLHGSDRGDELPEQLCNPRRRARQRRGRRGSALPRTASPLVTCRATPLSPKRSRNPVALKRRTRPRRTALYRASRSVAETFDETTMRGAHARLSDVGNADPRLSTGEAHWCRSGVLSHLVGTTRQSLSTASLSPSRIAQWARITSSKSRDHSFGRCMSWAWDSPNTCWDERSPSRAA